jgi:hypothetical protein
VGIMVPGSQCLLCLSRTSNPCPYININISLVVSARGLTIAPVVGARDPADAGCRRRRYMVPENNRMYVYVLTIVWISLVTLDMYIEVFWYGVIQCGRSPFVRIALPSSLMLWLKVVPSDGIGIYP